MLRPLAEQGRSGRLDGRRHAHGRAVAPRAFALRLLPPAVRPVTNPPIDPLREAIVMSLETCLGAERNVFEETAEHANRAILTTPVISPAKWRTIMNLERPGFERLVIDLNYEEGTGLEAAIRNIADQAEEAVRGARCCWC